MKRTLPDLPYIAWDEKYQTSPLQRIRTDEDVLEWKSTKGYSNFMLFLYRLNEASVGLDIAQGQEGEYSAVRTLLELEED